MKTNVSSLHAIVDYVIGALLLGGPWLFGFASDLRSALVTQAFGVAIIGYSLFTDYEPSFRRTIPIPAHLGLDMLCGGLLIGSPWIFKFAAITWIPHLVIGTVIAARPLLYAVASRVCCRRDLSPMERQSLPTSLD
jgi:hypothetical protein